MAGLCRRRRSASSPPSGSRSRAEPCTWMKKASTGSSSQGELQPPAGERAVLDRGAIEVGLEPARGPPREAHLRIPARRPVSLRRLRPDRRDGGRAARVKRSVRDAARLDFRLVIAGDEARRLDPVRHEIALEERSRRIAAESLRLREQRPGRRRCRPSPSMPSARVFGGASGDQARADEERRKRGGVIVVAPAGDVGKAYRAKDESPLPRSAGGAARSMRHRDGSAARVRRLRWRRASSSDRASRRRAQRSRRRGSSAPRSRRPPRPCRPCRACS